MPSERFTQAVEAYAKKIGGKTKWHERRLKCQTDLWFLSIEIFHRDLFERTHRPVVDFFLKKKPFLPAFQKDSEYGLAEFHDAIAALAPLEQRKGLLLYPRGTYKSSINADDITQYVICFPDVRILILVGEGSLGEAFVPDIKQRFVLQKNEEPTEFQLLFPEFIVDREIDKDRGGEQEYWCPVRRLKQKEPTLGFISILGATAGWHCDVFKPDDMINDTTPIETVASRGKVLRKFMTVSNLLDPHGIMEINGTRYHEEDAYDHLKSVLKNMRYLCGASWTALPYAAEKKLRDLAEHEVVLLFPERQGFAFLREKLLLDEDTFCLQQLNDPKRLGPSVKFRIEDLRKAVTRVPQSPVHKRYNFWDVATTKSDSADYTCGGFVAIDTDKWVAYVHYIILDKFTPSELAYQIAKLAKETQPERVMFEKYVATEQVWLEQEVKRIGVTMGYDIPVYAFKTDKTKMAKGNNICGLEPLITGERLFFSNLIPNLDAVFKHFTDFTGIPHPKRHDDAPDMLSMLRMVMPMTGMNMPLVKNPGMNLGLQMMDNAKDNAAWQQKQQTDAAVRAFLNATCQRPATLETSAAPVEGYFPGQ